MTTDETDVLGPPFTTWDDVVATYATWDDLLIDIPFWTLLLSDSRNYAAMFAVEGSLAVNIDGWLHLVNPTYALEQVATRQAGYSIEEYVSVDGQARVLPVTAVTSLEVKGYSEVPLRSREPLAVAMDVSSRYIPRGSDYNGLLWAPASGNRAFSFAALQEEAPALLENVPAYTVSGRWTTGDVLDFDGTEALTAPVKSWPGFIAVMAVVLRRGRGHWYGILDVTPPGPVSESPYVSLHYTDEDRLELWHDNSLVASAQRTSDVTDLVIIGMCVDEASDVIGFAAATPGQRATRSFATPKETQNLPVSGEIVVGRAAGQRNDGAVMQLVDLSVRIGEATVEEMDDLVTKYTSLYFAASSDYGEPS